MRACSYILLCGFALLLFVFEPPAILSREHEMNAGAKVADVRLGKDPIINNELIHAWNAIGRFDYHLALKLSNQILEQDPTCGQAYLFKGFCLYQFEKPKEAICYLKHGLSILPDSGKGVRMTPRYGAGWDYHVLATALLQINDKDEAMNVLNKGITIYGNMAILYSDRGNVYRLLNNNDAAIKDYTSEIKYGQVEGYENRAKAYLAMKKFDLAISDLTTAIAKSPDNSNLYAERSQAYKLTGHPDLAKKDLDAANSAGPESLFKPQS